jgi:hypothetical protein
MKYRKKREKEKEKPMKPLELHLHYIDRCFIYYKRSLFIEKKM